MNRRFLSLFSLFAFALTAAPLPYAQDEDPGPAPCKECGGAGLLPCPAHRGVVRGEGIDPRRRALYCHDAVGCETCGGLEWLDCPACENAAGQAWLEGRRAGGAAAAKRAAGYDEFMGRRLHLAESAHFLLVCELKPRKVGRAKADPHQLLHAWLDRLESLFEEYGSLLGAREEEFGTRSVVFLWQEREDHDRAGKEYCKWEWEEPWLYRRGSVNVFSLHGGDKRYRDDAVLHRTLVHHMVHGLMNLQRPSLWTGRSPGGWADAGLPHWFEDRYFGVCDTFCGNRVTKGSVFPPKRWRAGVRKLVAGNKVPALETLHDLTNAELTGRQHALGFSLIDYLMARDPAKLDLLLKRLRSRTPLRDSLQEIYGEKMEKFAGKWKAWVLATYGAR